MIAPANFRVIVFLGEFDWIAAGVERDVMAQARTWGEALERLDFVMRAEAASRDGTLNSIRVSPRLYEVAWEQGRPLAVAPNVRMTRHPWAGRLA